MLEYRIAGEGDQNLVQRWLVLWRKSALLSQRVVPRRGVQKRIVQKRIVLKRIASVSVSVALALTTACTFFPGNKAAPPLGVDPNDVVDDHSLYKIKILTSNRYDKHELTNSEQTVIGKAIKQKFNIAFEYIPVNGNYRDALKEMLRTGDYPEILIVTGQDLVKEYIAAEAALPLDDLLKRMPHFRERYRDAIPLWRLAADDDNLYKWEFGVPQDGRRGCSCPELAVRSDILQEQGWPKLLSSDDYINFLGKALSRHPETNGKPTIGMAVPFATPFAGTHLSLSLLERGEAYTLVGNGAVMFNVQADRFEDALPHAYTKESFQFFNRLNRAGILDGSSWHDTAQDVYKKVANGQALSLLADSETISRANRQLMQDARTQFTYVRLPIQTKTQVKRGEKQLVKVQATQPDRSVIVTNKARNVARLAQLLDWAASEEGQLLLQAGIEGTHYAAKDGVTGKKNKKTRESAAKRVPTKAFVKSVASNPHYLETQGFGLFNFLGIDNSVSLQDEEPYTFIHEGKDSTLLLSSKREKEIFKALRWKHARDWWDKNGVTAPVDIAMAIAVDPSSKLGKLEEKMVQLHITYAEQLITAESEKQFEKRWQELLDESAEHERERLADAYNELYRGAQKRIK